MASRVTWGSPLLAVLAVAALATTAGPADAPGDAAHGRVLFESKGCAGCHLARDQRAGMGLPLEEIRRPQGMYVLAGRLWNHAPAMFALFDRQGLTWPTMSLAEMADLMAYLGGTPSHDPAPDGFRGQLLLVRNGCLKCHRFRGEGGALASELTAHRGDYQSAVVWAATVWNHSPRMAARATQAGLLFPRFAGAEMGDLVEFLRTSAAAR